MNMFWRRRNTVTMPTTLSAGTINGTGATNARSTPIFSQPTRALAGVLLATAVSAASVLIPGTATAVEESQAVADTDTATTAAIQSNDELVLVPGSTSTVTFAVPQGMTPNSFTAQLNGAAGELLQITSATRTLTTVDAASGPVNIEISAADLSEESTLTLTFAYEGFNGTWCAVDGAASRVTPPIIVSDLEILTSGEPQLPNSVSEFFSGSRTAVITIPADAEESLVFAALDLVAGATAIMGQDSDVRLVMQGSKQAESITEEFSTVPAITQRHVNLSAESGDAVTAIDTSESGTPVLTIAGESTALAAAASAFGMTELALASSDRTSALSATQGAGDVTAAAETKTLSDLGIGAISLQGYGSKDAYVDVSQSSFGSILDSIDVNLVGTISSTAETIATVQLLWNSVLVDSFTVDPDQSVINRSITVPAAALRSGNGLVVRMQAVNATQSCVDERLLPQVRMDLSTTESTVTAHRGASPVATFQDFPQAFNGNAEVAFGSEVSAAAVTAATQLVAALQRSQPVRLNITGVNADALVSGSASGILIGASPEQAQELRTPLRFEDLRRISAGGDELTVAVNQPFAALQAIRSSDRSLLVLGEHSDGSDSDPSVLITATAGLSGTEWLQLNGAILLSTPDTDAVVLDINEIIPQEATKQDFNPVSYWAIGFVVALIALGVIASQLRKRRKLTAQRTADIQAQEEKALPAPATSAPQHAAPAHVAGNTEAEGDAAAQSRPSGPGD